MLPGVSPPPPPHQNVVEKIKVKSSCLDVMCAQISPLPECRKAHVLQQTWPLSSDTASRAPRTGTRTGTGWGWQDASLITPQICAEWSWQDSQPNPPSEETLTPDITAFAPCTAEAAVLLHCPSLPHTTCWNGHAGHFSSPREEYNQLQKD